MVNQNLDDYLEDKFLNIRKEILLYIYNRQDSDITVKDISNDLDKGYSYCHRIVKEFSEKGIVVKEKEGKQQLITLSESAKLSVKSLNEFCDKFKNL